MDKKALAFFKGNNLSYTIWDKKYRYNKESFDEWLNRVSGGNPEIRRLIMEKKFLFGGRTLRNRGTKDGSLSNCYSRGYVEDSLVDILKANSDIALTFKAQGGQGLSLSKIRPKGARIGDNFESDGILPFMEMFNTTTESISQGGSRKGALLMSLDVEHRQILDFITVKSDLKKINKANLSVEINDRFMDAVKRYYNNNETISYDVTKIYDSGPLTYTICPIKIYKKIVEQAYKYAEPGVLFVDQMRNHNLMEFVDDYQIETCNPCGEQPLHPHSSCNLSAINLSEYVIAPFTSNAKIDMPNLLNDLEYIIPAMDDIISENMKNHPLPEQRKAAERYRNIGVGFMGIADMLAKLRLIYGSIEANKFLDYLFNSIFVHGVAVDVALGKERGSFPGYSPKIWDSSIIKEHFDAREIEQFKRLDTLRNCSLFTIAPTGSIGTMLDVSTGIEPIFNLSYKRRTESLNKEEKTYEVKCGVFQDWSMRNPDAKEIPEYFITAKDIPWMQRIVCQSVVQKHIDTAISSTINLPKDTTLDDIEELYLYAWKRKLKGTTIYVDGSRDAILSDDATTNKIEFPETHAPKRPKELKADLSIVRAKGVSYAIIVGLLAGKPYEVFAFALDKDSKIKEQHGKTIKITKGSYDFIGEYDTIKNIHLNNELAEEKAHTYFISMLLRHGADIKYIIKTARKVNDNIVSFSSAICRVLSKYIKSYEDTGDKCPNCGSTLTHEGGCIHCTNCDYSQCMLVSATI